MPTKIVAVKPGGTEVLREVEYEPQIPGPGEVLVRHTAIGLNFLDIYFRAGLYPWPVEENLVLGSEAAGVVEAVGEGVGNFTKGERVAYTLANGAYCEQRVVEASQLVSLPDNVADEIAAGSILKGLTAHYLLHRSFKVKQGQTVLFHAAAGGVGLIAGQWLAQKGVITIGTAGGSEKCKLAAQNGYGHVIDYTSEDFVERVKEITNGEGVEAVYDGVGKDTYPGSLNVLKTFGTLVSFGQSSGPALDFKLSDLAAGSYFVTRPILFHFTNEQQYLNTASKELFEMIGKGALNININQRYRLSEIAKAHQALESRKTTGSTVLIP